MSLYSMSSMNLIVSIVLLLANIVNGRVPNSPLLDTYDYIIVGGGPGGLTVATRLSENPDITVLLLESGPIDHDEAWVRIPFFAGQGVGSTYDRNLVTVPQTSLDGKARLIPQGRALGGSTVINALLWNRGGAGDYDDWAVLGNPGWGWSDMLPYFIKSETFTPYPSQSIATLEGIGYEPSVHGSEGPVNVSFSNFVYNQSRNVFAALNELGIPTTFDPNEGRATGASFLPVSLNPDSQTRADARRSYNATIYSRPNLDVWTGQHVTRILFEMGSGKSDTTDPVPEDTSVGQGYVANPDGALSGVRNTTGVLDGKAGNAVLSRERSLISRVLHAASRWATRKIKTRSALDLHRSAGKPPTSTGRKLRAVGVEFAADASSLRRNITAHYEVIVSAGTIHTPQLLKLSGIGPLAELERHSIPILANLPGVGTNLQDHLLVGVYYPYANDSYLTSIQVRDNATSMMQAQEEYRINRTGPWTAGPPDGNAFPSLPQIVDGTNIIMPQSQAQNVLQYLPEGSDPSVVAGYTIQHSLMVSALQNITRAAYELLNFNYGAFSNANMRPFSRGTVTLNSSQPFDPPVIDPRYGSNPIDLEVLLVSLLFNRRILRTDAMRILQPQELIPPPNATEDELMNMLKKHVATEHHISCSCPMMPLSMGGVVDSDLLVYGSHNLRIVDASIMPLIPAGHIQAAVYAIGEKAADIIKAAYSSSPRSSAMASTSATSIFASPPLDSPRSQASASVSSRFTTSFTSGMSNPTSLTTEDTSASSRSWNGSGSQGVSTGLASSRTELMVTVTITTIVTDCAALELRDDHKTKAG